jgi:hypothetical protein
VEYRFSIPQVHHEDSFPKFQTSWSISRDYVDDVDNTSVLSSCSSCFF